MVAHVKKVAPWGVTVTVKPESGASPAWSCDPTGPAFDAAAARWRRATATRSRFIGAGGSIPFVGPFAEAFGGAPALLIGLEDPICNAHSENESLQRRRLAPCDQGCGVPVRRAQPPVNNSPSWGLQFPAGGSKSAPLSTKESRMHLSAPL